MKTKNIGTVIFLSLLLSSCGLIEKFKTSDDATESSEASNTSTAELDNSGPSDDLFSSETKTAESSDASHADAPSNVTSSPENAPKDELAEMKSEFSDAAPTDSSVKETKPVINDSLVANDNVAQPKAKKSKINVKETATDFNSEAEVTNVQMGNEVKNYKVQKGETLMQIAFKLYGDISKWKELKRMNNDKLSSNSALNSNMNLKYMAPETPFVWNPEGTPYLIKNGETLGSISSSVYQTPKKWKVIWDNNRQLIKNPNLIYAGFTLYYKNGGMANNYVQPQNIDQEIERNESILPVKTMTKTLAPVKEIPKDVEAKQVEEIKVEKALSAIERLDSNAEEVNDIRSAPVRSPASSEEDKILTELKEDIN